MSFVKRFRRSVGYINVKWWHLKVSECLRQPPISRQSLYFSLKQKVRIIDLSQGTMNVDECTYNLISVWIIGLEKGICIVGHEKKNSSRLNNLSLGPISQENAISRTPHEQSWVCFEIPSKILWEVCSNCPVLCKRLQISPVDLKSWDGTWISADARHAVFCQLDSLVLNDTDTAWSGHLHRHILLLGMLQCSDNELSQPPNTPVTYWLKMLLPHISHPGKNMKAQASSLQWDTLSHLLWLNQVDHDVCFAWGYNQDRDWEIFHQTRT